MKLTNHIMACSYCNGMSEKYCPAGRELWIDSKAEWIASQKTSQDRRSEYKRIAAAYPKYADQIKQQVVTLCNAGMQQNQNTSRRGREWAA